MSKRDDDSQADMEVGMTTAERRRRRRRGGLRVPSDNVPRRSSTPPVAPVPEDPALAMSIAYSFSAESSEPRPRDSAPSFEHHEGMPTVIDPVIDPGSDPMIDAVIDPVIDPVSGRIEQADFDMKTREMTAVDLEELGLSELMPGYIPMGRATLRDLEPIAMTPAPDDGVAVARRGATEPAEDVEVDLDASVDGVVDAGMTLDQELGDGAGRSAGAVRRGAGLDADIDLDSDSAEPTAIHPGPPAPPAELAARAAETSQPRPVAVVNEASAPRVVTKEASGPRSAQIAAVGGDAPYPRVVANEASGPRPAAIGSMPIPPVTAPPGGGIRMGRAQTVALSEDDLEEVREAARLATQPAFSQAPHAPHAPPPPQAPHASGYPPVRPASTSIPPPMPPVKPPKPRTTAQLSVPAMPVPAMPAPAAPAMPVPTAATPAPVMPAPAMPTIEVRPVEDRGAEAATEFEVDVDGIVDAKVVESAPGEVAPPPPIPPSRESQQMGIVRDPSHAPPPPPGAAAPGVSIQPPSMPPPRESQQMGIVRDPSHAPPPPPAHKAPPSPPPAKKDRPAPAAVAPLARPDAREAREPRDQRELRELRDGRDGRDAKGDGKSPRGKPWFIDLFDEDYLRTLPFLTPQATQAEAEFVINAMGLSPGAQVLDIGCGYGRHAMELAARGFHIVGLDLSTPLLVRGGEEAHRRGLTINFVRGDMRELDFEAQFDGAYCLFSTFGYFDDETNKKTVANIARALRPGGRMLIEILNRDYVIADLPTRVWWEGDGCVVLEEVELNYFSSRIQVNRSVVFDDGRQLEQEISVRAYSLHEVGKLMHSAGLRVLEVSGAYHTRGRFFGNQSRHIIVLAERKDPSAS